jgi:hypothetical protein
LGHHLISLEHKFSKAEGIKMHMVHFFYGLPRSLWSLAMTIISKVVTLNLFQGLIDSGFRRNDDTSFFSVIARRQKADAAIHPNRYFQIASLRSQ